MTEEQITAAARALADHNADVCNVNREDNWMIYGDSFRESAEIALRAAAGTIADAVAIAEREALSDEYLTGIAEEIMKGMRAIATWEPRRNYAVRVLRERLTTPSPKPAVDALTTGAVGGDRMTDSQVLQWIDACNHMPARNALRELLKFRAHPDSEPTVGGVNRRLLRILVMRHAKSYSEWDDGSLSRVDFGQYGFDRFVSALIKELAHPASEPKALTVTDEQIKAMARACGLYGVQDAVVSCVRELLADRGSEGKS